MAQQLHIESIDTVWFNVAADLNEFFSDRSFMLATAREYMDDLGVSLLDANLKTFDQLISGQIGLNGQALDNYLVNKEQMFVQKFTAAKFGDSVPGAIWIPVNTAFGVGRGALNPNIELGVTFVEAKFGEPFNFWDTAHRISLGEAMMSIARHRK